MRPKGAEKTLAVTTNQTTMNDNEKAKQDSITELMASLTPEARERMMLVLMLEKALTNPPLMIGGSPQREPEPEATGWRLPKKDDRVRVIKDPEACGFYKPCPDVKVGDELIVYNLATGSKRDPEPPEYPCYFGVMAYDPKVPQLEGVTPMCACIPLECLEPVTAS